MYGITFKMQNYKFTIGEDTCEFSCKENELQTFFANKFQYYQLVTEYESDFYAVGEYSYKVVAQIWVPDSLNPHKGEKVEVRVPLMKQSATYFNGVRDYEHSNL
jgi:hypothetical protein